MSLFKHRVSLCPSSSLRPKFGAGFLGLGGRLRDRLGRPRRMLAVLGFLAGSCVGCATRPAPVPPQSGTPTAVLGEEPGVEEPPVSGQPRPRYRTTVRVEGGETAPAGQAAPEVLAAPPLSSPAEAGEPALPPTAAPAAVPGSWQRFGRIRSIDRAEGLVVILADSSGAPPTRELVSRSDMLEPTGILLLLPVSRAGVFVASIREGDPRPGDEIVYRRAR